MAKLTADERKTRAKKVAKLYGKKSIREISEETGWSYGHVHNLLKHAGVSMRPRGGARR